jgi:oxygen-dependent protoporphyrinogen oxidase
VSARRIAVVGGGISGLTAAHLLLAAGQDVTLFDAGDEPGGLIRSARREGFLCERGPQALLDGAGDVRSLIASAGLTGRALGALPASRRRFVYVGGALRPFPASPPALFRTSLLSAAGKARLFAEPFIRRAKAPDPDESVLDFIARRFGPEAARRAAAPALIGIYAGDAAAISVRAAFPRLAELEQAHGSVLRGMFRSRGKSGSTARMGRPTSFPEGLAELPRALAAAMGPRRVAARVDGLSPRPAGGWVVVATSKSLEFETVLLATPAAATATLLEPHAPGAAGALRAIPHAPVAVVTLGFRSPPPGSLGMDLDAYGFVVARGEGVAMLGCQYETSVFPGRAPDGAVLVRALLGGTFNPELVDADDATLAAQAVADLRRVAGLRRDPDFADVARARPGIPQYERGHAARVAAVDEGLGRWPGLHAIGHALRGLGVSASIGAATQAARQIAAVAT